MAIAEKLIELSRLRDTGALTDEEFAVAKKEFFSHEPGSREPQEAAHLGSAQATSLPRSNKGTSSQFLNPKANLKTLLRFAVIIAVLCGGIWLFLRFSVGEKAANTIVGTLVKAPVDLQDSVVTVEASSMMSIPLSLPYTGSLSVMVEVVRGNPMDVFLVDASGLQEMKAGNRFAVLSDFEAIKTKTMSRTARLNNGVYYLVLRDTSLGLFSSSTSDVKVRVKLSA
jgi:hypothetical protein